MLTAHGMCPLVYIKATSQSRIRIPGASRFWCSHAGSTSISGCSYPCPTGCFCIVISPPYPSIPGRAVYHRECRVSLVFMLLSAQSIIVDKGNRLVVFTMVDDWNSLGSSDANKRSGPLPESNKGKPPLHLSEKGSLLVLPRCLVQ